MGTLQFGNKVDGIKYNERPGAYAVIRSCDDKYALIEAGGKYHLPGGGIRSGESIDSALKREVSEEIGLVFNDACDFGSANQFCKSGLDEKYYNKLCHYFLITNFNEEKSLEDVEHEIHWVSFEEAVSKLGHESHAWAIKAANKNELT